MSCGFYMEVERGPRWLAELLYCNQDIGSIAVLVFVLFLGGFGYALKKWDITDEEKAAMVRNGGTVSAMAAATVLIGKVSPSYPVTVIGGVVVGYVVWTFLLGPRILKKVE